MTFIHINRPEVREFCAVNECPTCKRPRRMLGQFAEWYGTSWTCAGCGDMFTEGHRHERPFAAGWRRRSIERARASLARIGVQA